MDIETVTSTHKTPSTQASNSPKVSIGMPVYNGEAFIREALDSLLAQTFTDFELIISDNASTDGTEAICREYAAKDARIRYVRQAENRGGIPNFQFVLDEAVGEYFMWAAADDVWLPNFIQHCRLLLDEDRSAEMATTAYKCVSRCCPMFNRTFPHVLDCIENENQEARVIAYARQPFSTHKDNLVYALWRRVFLEDLVQEMERVFDGPFPVGTAMNEYALLKSRGRYHREILFHKRYRYIPPGHWVGPLLKPIVPIWRWLKGKPPAGKPSGYGGEQFLADLSKLMDSSGATKELVQKIVAANQSHVRVRRLS